MKTNELELKLQAYLDSELHGKGRQEIEVVLKTDSVARKLLEELKAVKAVLADNELEISCPESREFYWSQISREITPTATAATHSSPSILELFKRYALPSGMVAVISIVLLLFINNKQNDQRAETSPLDESEILFGLNLEIDTDFLDASTITFRSESEAMTVVWVDTNPFD